MGNALSKKDIQSLLKKKILDKRSISFSLMGEIGVYLSHLQILKDFVLSKQKYCLIFEDDIHLEKNFKIDLRDQHCKNVLKIGIYFISTQTRTKKTIYYY